MNDIRIALIEDHDLTRVGMRATLQQHGFRVIGEASNGTDGLRLITTAKPDIAIVEPEIESIVRRIYTDGYAGPEALPS